MNTHIHAADSRRRLTQRYKPFFVWTLLLAMATAHAQPEIRSLTGVIEGHQVGGVTIDMVGNIYVADFGDLVWKITPEGERQILATGLYGASGNAIDNEGNLLQASYYGDSITKVDRKGQATLVVTSGLNGPIGVAIDRQTGDIYVANCRGNSVAKIAVDGTVAAFAQSALFNCPNGITFDGKGNLYVVNFRDDRMLKVDPKGVVTPFATLSQKGMAQKGLGHVCFKKDRFYVTAYQAHAIYEVTLQGDVRRLLGNGVRGMVDGADTSARLSFPNGIACSPWAPRLYINEYLNDSETILPRRMTVRVISLEPDK
jgi:DNA-binding beta-propeller fold protein YncE